MLFKLIFIFFFTSNIADPNRTENRARKMNKMISRRVIDARQVWLHCLFLEKKISTIKSNATQHSTQFHLIEFYENERSRQWSVCRCLAVSLGFHFIHYSGWMYLIATQLHFTHTHTDTYLCAPCMRYATTTEEYLHWNSKRDPKNKNRRQKKCFSWISTMNA